MTLNFSISSIQRKAKHYCSYQERSHKEVIQKLYNLGARKFEAEQVIVWLIEEDYLNEERFAIQFSSGRFKLKKWGRVKIKQALQQKGVSIYNIDIALDKINEEAYEKTLYILAHKKWSSLKTGTEMIKRMKTYKYLLQKGYEKSLINLVLAKLNSKPQT